MRYFSLIWILLTSGFVLGQSQTKEVFMCKATTLRLKAESTGAFRYEWYRNNELVIGSFANELVVSEEGTYKALGVNEDGCVSQESIQIIVKHHTPSAIDDVAEGKVNTDVVIDVLQNDLFVCADFDIATLNVLTQPLDGTVAKVDGKFVYSPAIDFKGEVTFTYTVRDKTGQQTNVANVKLGIVTGPLPVTLTYFDAKKTETHTNLDWGTSEESNSDHFDVERSSDMKNWAKIGMTKAAFESKTDENYHYTDSLPESGLNYYRLKMVDVDESFAFSRIRSVHFPELSWAEVYPNPVADLLYIIIRNKKVKNIRMISNAGTVRFTQKVDSNSLTISMKQYPTGMYYIHFEQDDGAVKIFKVMHD